MNKKNMQKYEKLFSLEKKVAIVTGAYGHLGSTISQALAGFGATVVLIGRNEEKLKTLITKYHDLMDKFEYYVCDITDEQKFCTIVEDIEDNHKTIDILVNNAYEK